MHLAHPSRTQGQSSRSSVHPPLLHLLATLSILLLTFAAPAQTTSPTFQITSATFGTTGLTAIPAGVPGGTFQLTGTLPTSSSQAQTPVNACFSTGYGSTTGFQVSLPNGTNTEPLTVPASTIQSIPSTAFTATNNYAITGYLYFVRTGVACDGTYDTTLTNRYGINIIAPAVLAYTGPTSIPKTNTATSIVSPPTYLSLPGRGFLTNGQYGASTPTAVTFGTFGTVTSDLANGNLHIPIPTAFSSSPIGTTAALTLCNNFSTISACTTPDITFTVSALSASSGILTATPSPVTTAGQTTLTAQFFKTGNTAGSPGAPSGQVTFTATGATIPAANLILDKTATFTTQASTITVPTTPTPTIAPAAGSYLNSVTVTLADTNTTAAIYYTQDGNTPSSASTRYTAPFQITTSQTIQAIAVIAGALPSTVASSAYTITISPPAKLAFAVQPVNTATGTVINPAVQVAIQDANGNIVNNSTLPVTLALANNSSGATLGGTLTVNAVNGIANFPDLTVDNIANSYLLVATSGSLARATSAAFNITPYPITIAVQSALIGINSTLNGTITLGHAAPQGGLVVTLASDTPANVTVSPATLTIVAGQTTGSFTYTGVAAGNATLSASATNYQTGTVQVTGTAAQVSLGTIPTVAPGQTVSLALSLPTAAPAGGTTVTFTSSNTGVATVTGSILVPAGQRTATSNPQITGITIGTTTIVASAPGYAPDTRAVNVTVTATFNPSATSIAFGTYNTTTLNISAPAQTGGITFTLSSDDTTKAAVPASVTIPQGGTSVPVPLTGVGNGTTTIRADSTGVTEAILSVTVNNNIGASDLTTGIHLQNTSYYTAYLSVPPPNPITVTYTISNPSIATISTSPTVVGTTTLTFPNITSAGYLPQIYLQGQSIGTTTLTVSAPGYTSGTATMTVGPAGFVILSGDINTTTFSSPTAVSIYPTLLSAGSLGYNGYLRLNPGLSSISVPVTSSNTSIGTITTSPVIFNAGDTYESTPFQPASAGSTTIALGATPAGFSTPSNYQQITATVTAPALSAGDLTTGVNLQNTSYYLAYVPVAPPTPVTVTVTISNPAIAILSKSSTTVGVATLTFPNTANAGYLPQFYIQGLSAGTASMTVSAPGYTTATSTITVNPSGFTLVGNGSTFTTTTFSGPTTIYVYPSVLNPSDLGYSTYLSLNPGAASVSVPVTSSNTSTGTITTSPVVFNSGDSAKTTGFQPAAAGTTTIAIAGTPAGYSTPSNYQQIAATVSAPAISSSDVLTGVTVQNVASYFGYLPVAPPTPETVTVTLGNPAIATISKSSTTVGVTTLTFPNISSAGYIPAIYVQGQSAGTTTITVSAPGYTSATSTITVFPSGFTFAGTSTLSTTTFSSPTPLSVNLSLLNPSSLSYYTSGGGLTLNPGARPVTVSASSSNTSVGTISPVSVTFNPGDSYQTITFQPLGAGSTNVTLGAAPAGYSTPTQYTQVAATVSAPQISVGTSATGLNLESNGGYYLIYLPANPPNPVTVTVTSNGPAIATISSSATSVGTTTLNFPNITSAGYLPLIYIQGQSLGSTTLTASAPGYTNGNGSVTVYPSGFAFAYSSSLSTTTTSSPTPLTVYPFVLNTGSLTIQNTASLNPGLTVSVPVTSSDPATGTVNTSPLVFNGGDSSQSTSFTPLATGTTTLTVQPPTGFSTPSQYQQITATVQ